MERVSSWGVSQYEVTEMASKPADPAAITRRDLMSSAAAVAAVSVTGDALAARASREPATTRAIKTGTAPAPPFDSMRDYVAALEHHGLLRRFGRSNDLAPRPGQSQPSR